MSNLNRDVLSAEAKGVPIERRLTFWGHPSDWVEGRPSIGVRNVPDRKCHALLKMMRKCDILLLEKEGVDPKRQNRGNAVTQSRASFFKERQIAEDLRGINLSQAKKSAWDFLLIKAGMPRTEGER